jgi:hypothetical protein
MQGQLTSYTTTPLQPVFIKAGTTSDSMAKAIQYKAHDKKYIILRLDTAGKCIMINVNYINAVQKLLTMMDKNKMPSDMLT